MGSKAAARISLGAKIGTCFLGLALSATLLGASLPATETLGLPLDPEIPISKLLITRWTTESGLPTNFLLRVAQSPDGYLWISSFSGLIRFDGLDFEVFDRRQFRELSTDGFSRLKTDRFGRFWIGTRADGFFTYKRGRLEPLGEELTEPRRAVQDILVDRQGKVWVGFDDLGVFRYLDGYPEPVAHAGISGVTVPSIAEDAQGSLWFATFGKGISRFRQGHFTTFTTEHGLPDNEVSRVLPGRGTLWIATSSGLAQMVEGRPVRVAELAGMSVISLVEDRHGSLWIGTESHGLLRRNGRTGHFERLTHFQDEEIPHITDMALDREGSLWFTTVNGGLFQVRNSFFENLSVSDGLSAEMVETIGEHRPGEYWVGFARGAANRVRGDRISALDLEPIRHGTRVRHIYRDRAGEMWIASAEGLLHVGDEKRTLFTESGGLPSKQLRLTYQDSMGRIWVGTDKGMAVQRPDGRFEPAPGELGSPSRFILSVNEHSDGRLVVGTRGSLLIWEDDDPVDIYSSAHGLPGNAVFSTLADPDGSVWLATNGGLARLSGGEIRVLDKPRGLPVDSVFDLKTDSRGFLWLSSAVGLIRLSMDQLRAYMDGEAQDVDAEVFDERDGMIFRECVGARKMLQDSSGRLWVPTLKGVASLDPERLPSSSRSPLAVIDRLLVDDRIATADPDGSYRLEPNPQRIEIVFAIPSFIAPAKLRVQYRLTGYDTDWIDTGLERSVFYTNLRPGKYAFQVRAVDHSEGRPGEIYSSLDFSILPAFHQSKIFLAASLILGLFGIRWIFRYRMLSIRRRNEQLEVLNRDLESKNRALEDLGFSFSHDLKTPLVSIQGFVGLLEQDAREGRFEDLHADIEEIRNATHQMNLLLNGLRELSSLGGRQMQRQSFAYESVIQEALRRLRRTLEARGAEVSIGDDLPQVVGHREMLVRALEQLIDNAAKFVAEGQCPSIEIGVRPDKAEPVFYVRDRGIGIDPDHRHSIFKLFQRLDPSHEGVGIGLVVAERVVKAHGGTLWVESDGAGKGSTFCFSLAATSRR